MLCKRRLVDLTLNFNTNNSMCNRSSSVRDVEVGMTVQNDTGTISEAKIELFTISMRPEQYV